MDIFLFASSFEHFPLPFSSPFLSLPFSFLFSLFAMSPKDSKDSDGLSSHMKIAMVVTAYFVVSIALVFSNKVLLSSPGATIPAPLFVTWFQCVLTAAIIYGLGAFGEGKNNGGLMNELPRKKPGKTTINRRNLSLVLSFALTLSLCSRRITSFLCNCDLFFFHSSISVLMCFFWMCQLC